MEISVHHDLKVIRLSSKVNRPYTVNSLDTYVLESSLRHVQLWSDHVDNLTSKILGEDNIVQDGDCYS